MMPRRYCFSPLSIAGALIERGEHLTWLKHFQDLLRDWLTDTERLECMYRVMSSDYKSRRLLTFVSLFYVSSSIREIVEIEYEAFTDDFVILV